MMAESSPTIESLPDQVEGALDQARRSVPRLVLVVGGPNTGKSQLAMAIGAHKEAETVNLGLELSRALLPISIRQRPLVVEELLRELIPSPSEKPLILDNTEILFETYLQLNPIRVLEKLARNQLIVATWNGTWSPPKLSFGFREHPAYFECRPTGFPILEVHGSTAPTLFYP